MCEDEDDGDHSTYVVDEEEDNAGDVFEEEVIDDAKSCNNDPYNFEGILFI